MKKWDYASCINESESTHWGLNEVFTLDCRFDLKRPLLPWEYVPLAAKITDESQRLTLNHITSSGFLRTLCFLEEFSILNNVQHLTPDVEDHRDNLRALLRLAEQDLKHQALFERSASALARDLTHPCPGIESSSEMTHVILTHSPLAVLLLTVHFEMITEQHYLMAHNQQIDDKFKTILEYHYRDEKQHIRLNILEIEKRLLNTEETGLLHCIDDYQSVLCEFIMLFSKQAEMDLKSYQELTGHPLTKDQLSEWLPLQFESYKLLFLSSAFKNQRFKEFLKQNFSVFGRKLELFEMEIDFSSYQPQD